MSTRFDNEGNIGAAPEYHEYPNDNEEPHRILRMSVYFDNPVPVKDGFEDRGGFWAPVELWSVDAERLSKLYQTGMRVFVRGRMVKDDWQDRDENPRVTFKVQARRISILPNRIESVTLIPKSAVAPSGGG